ncbi:hypothetical protein B0H14DRAFT_1172536 [Mycena olivaceomarginata]|nr:hypothetical protein B0H14DRAFT_1172536 [Mycena olivaceomarginata]
MASYDRTVITKIGAPAICPGPLGQRSYRAAILLSVLLTFASAMYPTSQLSLPSAAMVALVPPSPHHLHPDAIASRSRTTDINKIRANEAASPASVPHPHPCPSGLADACCGWPRSPARGCDAAILSAAGWWYATGKRSDESVGERRGGRDVTVAEDMRDRGRTTSHSLQGMHGTKVTSWLRRTRIELADFR